MGGRPAKTPTAILDARGSWRAKTRPSEPKPVARKLRRPSWVMGPGAKHWDNIAEVLYGMRVTSQSDLLALVMLVEALGHYLECKRIIDEEGLMLKAINGIKYKHPLCAEMRAAWKEVLQLLIQFGMTPSSRANVYALSKEGINGKEDIKELFLIKGNKHVDKK